MYSTFFGECSSLKNQSYLSQQRSYQKSDIKEMFRLMSSKVFKLFVNHINDSTART